MKRNILFWKLFLGNALLMAAVLLVLGWLTASAVDRFTAQDLTAHLKAQAISIIQATGDRFDAAHSAELDRFVKQLRHSQSETVRYTLILADGTVVAESEAEPRTMELHGDRPEVRKALADGWGENLRFSPTLKSEMNYVAVRVGDAQAPMGVVRVAMPLRTIAERTRAEEGLIWAIALAGVVAVVVLALGLARLWSRPIRRITIAAQSLSSGDLSARAHVTGRDELAVLARSLNEMRDHLATQLATIDRQKRVLESLLAQVSEGVVVAGPDGRIVLVNPAAIRLLALTRPAGSPGTFEGLAVEECIRQHDLQQALLQPEQRSGTAGGTSQQTDRTDRADRGGVGEESFRELRLNVEAPQGRLVLLGRACDVMLPGLSIRDDRLDGAERPITGRLLVLTDITELARMMQIKADFAANTSHELRTPLSAIRGAVETLGQINWTEDPDAARRFVEVVDRHSQRMEALVSDLLDLSRIESSPGLFAPTRVNLRELLADLRAHINEALAAKTLEWKTDVPAGLEKIVANPYLLRLTLENLVDNAIKFTGVGGRIAIVCRDDAKPPGGPRGVSIEVSDTGCGIPEEEQGRVFERFYQVERARSGAARGTGLGLSIVRHAVAGMSGTVALRSKVGEGTSITVTIPQAA